MEKCEGGSVKSEIKKSEERKGKESKITVLLFQLFYYGCQDGYEFI
jgi:hypothetical protein